MDECEGDVGALQGLLAKKIADSDPQERVQTDKDIEKIVSALLQRLRQKSDIPSLENNLSLLVSFDDRQKSIAQVSDKIIQIYKDNRDLDGLKLFQENIEITYEKRKREPFPHPMYQIVSSAIERAIGELNL